MTSFTTTQESYQWEQMNIVSKASRTPDPAMGRSDAGGEGEEKRSSTRKQQAGHQTRRWGNRASRENGHDPIPRVLMVNQGGGVPPRISPGSNWRERLTTGSFGINRIARGAKPALELPIRSGRSLGIGATSVGLLISCNRKSSLGRRLAYDEIWLS